MEDIISPIERRRRAALRFWHAAENARFSSRVLWSTSSEAANAIRSEFFCGDANSEALVEAYRREASVALELVIKAVIAQRVENGTADMHVGSVPMTHNLPTLWENAKLPKLPKDDKGRLLKAKYILLWTGRYPAPKTDEDFERMRSELKAHKVITGQIGRFTTTKDLSFAWDDFDRIYQVAADTFRAIIPYTDEDGWLIIPEGPRKFTRE